MRQLFINLIGGFIMDAQKLNEGVLCQLKIGRWDASMRLSKDKFAENLPKDIVRGMQDLVDDRSCLQDLLTVKRLAKRALVQSSLNFPVNGVFWVPKHKIVWLDETLTEKKREYRDLTEELISNMGKIKRRFRRKYPDFYNEENYPSDDELRSKHHFTWQFFQFQLPSKKAGILTASMYKREQEKLKGMAKEMNEMAIAIIGKTLLARIDKLKEQCENDKINAGTLNSLERFLGKWDDIWKDNVDSSKLKTVMRSLRIQMKKTSADGLRSSEDFRNQVAKKMEGIVKQVKAIPDFKVKRKLDV
jgi:hypothetical protein